MSSSYDNWLQAAGGMDRSTWPDLVNKAIDEIWEMRDSADDLSLGQLFDVENIPNTLTHTLSYVTNELPLPQKSEDTDPLPYVTANQGRDKSFTCVQYRLAVRATDTAFRVQRFDEIMFSLSGMTTAASKFDELQRASIFANAFSGTDGDDSLCLCHNTHPNEVRATGTWDNLGTGALSGSNLHALRLLMEKMTGARGRPRPVTGKVILIPPDLEQTVVELTKTDKKPDTALNNVNALLPDFGYIKSPWLTSTTAYFVIGNLQGREKGLHEVRLMDWEIGDNDPQNVDIKIDRRIKGIKTFGFTHSRNIAGSAG